MFSANDSHDDYGNEIFEEVVQFVDNVVIKCQKSPDWGESSEHDLSLILNTIFKFLRRSDAALKLINDTSLFASHFTYAIMACCPLLELELGRKKIRYAVEDALESYYNQNEM